MAGCAGAVLHGEYGALQYRGEVRKVSKAFLVHLKNVNADNSTGSPSFNLGSGTLHPRSAASPGATAFNNVTASPLPYANSPNSGTNMSTPPPQRPQLQQQTQQQQQVLQRQKMMQQLPQHQQLLAQQQLRQTAMTGLGQFGISGANAQRTHASQILNAQMFNMGAASATGMMPLQQQQQQQAVSQGAFATMVPNPQRLQPGMGTSQHYSRSSQFFTTAAAEPAVMC